jgi:hypothetical protein
MGVEHGTLSARPAHEDGVFALLDATLTAPLQCLASAAAEDLVAVRRAVMGSVLDPAHCLAKPMMLVAVRDALF